VEESDLEVLRARALGPTGYEIGNELRVAFPVLLGHQLVHRPADQVIRVVTRHGTEGAVHRAHDTALIDDEHTVGHRVEEVLPRSCRIHEVVHYLPSSVIVPPAITLYEA
jgi:hypothetical protein